MKNKPDKVMDKRPALNGGIQGTPGKVEVKVTARDACRCPHLRGQACFRCLCLFGLPGANQ